MLNIFSTTQEKNGISLYWNDEKLIVEEYNKVEKHYYCGKELLQFKEGKTIIYTILVVDVNEYYFADVFSDGEIVKLATDTNIIPGKQKQGGQSHERYMANRENGIVLWFKEINEILKAYDRQIILGINHIYHNKFISYLNTYNKSKIIKEVANEYSGLEGIYDTINRLEKDKQGPVV